MSLASDTIFGLATAPPPSEGSGVAIVRLSGPEAFEVGSKLCDTVIDVKNLPDRTFRLAKLSHEGRTLDTAGLLPFHKPHSYTGEDVLEIHCHGGFAVIGQFERALSAAGARPAEPGEFTRRAFLNGRIDLVQAEAIAALVGAAGDAAMREALRRRSGTLSLKVEYMRNTLRDLLAGMEVVFDYPEEDIAGIEPNKVVGILDSIHSTIEPLISSYRTGLLLSGFRLAIIGRPNVGKSSLLNALLREDRAIVTSRPGTTRDVVSGTLAFGGVPAECLDTAGIRVIPEDSDTIEAEGIRRSWQEVGRAHMVVIVLDLSTPLTDEDLALVKETRKRTKETGAAILLVCNKTDLATAWSPDVAAGLLDAVDLSMVEVSAKTGENIDSLREEVRNLLGLECNPEEIMLTDARHVSLLEESDRILKLVGEDLGHEMPQDVAATALWGVDRLLGRILGEDLSAVDLDEIFSRFCIGK